ncbi:MAG: methyltransferase domain-containing protein [Desulfurivibrionaceae bacterium]|nr:methyltransferase domain-containing protein [Desulfobulbales bacterium]MDT8334141.1 methyltransferase domain-containing protein [Desulfurivibrionaceae bacterium]
MTEDALPEKVAGTLRQIRRKYKTEFGTLRVRDLDLRILQVSDIEPLLKGKDPFEDVSRFPFWVRLWDAALILADTMVNLPPPPGNRLLELGAGLGAPGLAAAAAGYRVTLSDYEPHILDFQRVSAAANNLQDVEFKIIDWNKPPAMARFDTIIGAEILFREDFFEPLLKILRRFLAPDGTVYLAHDAERLSLAPFLEMASRYFTIGVIRRKITTEDKEITVLLNRLRFREDNS